MPASPLPGFHCNCFHCPAALGTHFLGFIMDQSLPKIVSPSITPAALALLQDNDLIISEERQVFIRISERLSNTPSLPSRSYIHTQTLFSLKALLRHFYVSFSSHALPQQHENQRSRRARFPDEPAPFTPPTSFTMSRSKMESSPTRRVLLYQGEHLGVKE